MKSCGKRYLSILLAITLILTCLPVQIFAADEHAEINDETFKEMSLRAVRNGGRTVSFYNYGTGINQFCAPSCPGYNDSWYKMIFVIEKSQPVALMLYRMAEGAEYEDDELFLTYDPSGENEPFLGDFMGYVYGIPVTDNVVGSEDDDKVSYEPISDADWMEIYRKVIVDETGEYDYHDYSRYFAFGYQGEKYLNIDPATEIDPDTLVSGKSGGSKSPKRMLKSMSAPAVTTGAAFEYSLPETEIEYDDESCVLPPKNDRKKTLMKSLSKGSSDDTSIQNILLWDGKYIPLGGSEDDPVTLTEPGRYVIVLQPLSAKSSIYNSFLAFDYAETDDEGNPLLSDSFENIKSLEQLESIRESLDFADPVDPLSGAFTWGYTDLSLYGKYDLPFTRSYNSFKEKDLGFGKGFSSNYSYSLEFVDNDVCVSMPGAELTFCLDFDGSYRSCGDYSLELSGGCYIVIDRTGNSYVFNADGKITQIAYLDGNVVTFNYENGKLSEVYNTSGSLFFEYDDDHVAKVSGNTGRSVSFEYAEDLLVSCENSDADSLLYSYDENGYLAGVKNFEGETYIENVYDAAGRVIHQNSEDFGTFDFSYDTENRINSCVRSDDSCSNISYDALGRIIEAEDNAGSIYYEYDSLNHVISFTDREGNTARYSYDEAGNISKIIYADGSIEEYLYDENRNIIWAKDGEGFEISMTYDGSRLTSFTDAKGNIYSYFYDSAANLTSETGPLGDTTEYSYDSKGNCVSITDALGNTMHFEYDGLGRLVKETDPNGAETAYEYTDAGKLTAVTDALGNRRSFTVNGNGFNTKESDFLGNAAVYTYDAQSHVTSVTDPEGGVISYEYDEQGNLAVLTDALGNETRFSYDLAGRMVSMTDANGNVSSFTYDNEGRIVSAADSEGGTVKDLYDELGRVIKETDANGNSIRYEYDFNGRLVKVIDALSKSEKYEYDANGNLIKQTDRNGNVWHYVYDEENRLTEEIDPSGNVSKYSYDALGRLVSVTSALENTESFAYDAAGNIISETDPMGHETSYVYDAKGRLTKTVNSDGTSISAVFDANSNVLSVTDEEGFETGYSYDKNGRITRLTNARGFDTAYEYDKAGNLTAVTDAAGGKYISVYDANGNLVSEADPEGNTVFYAYDGLDRVISITDAEGNETKVSYDKNCNVSRIIQADESEISYTYSARNELTGFTDAEGYSHSFSYDANGNLITETDANGNTTEYAYDALNRLVMRLDSEGGIQTQDFDADGRLVKFTDEEGGETLYFYDADGKIVRLVNALGFETLFEYDEMDRVTKVTDARGGDTSYTYTARGEVKSVTDALGYVTSYEYDENGNCIAVTTEDGTTSYEYDALDRLVKTVNPDGTSTELVYDANGRVVSAYDANGNVTSYVYDALGNVTETIDALGNSSLFEYDSMGNLTKTSLHRVDAQDNVDSWEVTLYEYDSRGLVTKEIDALGNVTTYVYDGNGNLISKTDADGFVSEYSYNALDLVSGINYSGGKEITYRFNAAGDLVQMSDWLGKTSFEVDLLHRITAATDHKGNRVEYTYDEVGNQTEIVYPDGSIAGYEYDLVGNLTAVTEPEGDVTTWAYDGMGRKTEMHYPNGWAEYYSYDSMGRLTAVRDTHPSEKSAKTQKHVYEYDANGNIVYEYMRGNGTGQAKNETLYTYDALNRLVSAHDNYGNSTRTYTYDSLGNLTFETGNGSHNTDYRYNDLNQLLSQSDDGFKTYTESSYDRRGNLVLEEYHKNKKTVNTIGQYTFDETNRMVRGINAAGEESLYTYNGLGALMENTWIIAENAYGYHGVNAGSSDNSSVNGKGNGNKNGNTKGNNGNGNVKKTASVIKQFTVDFTSPVFSPLTEHEVNGLDYRYVYSNDARLSVNVHGIKNGSASLLDESGNLRAYYHCDYLGTTDYLTSAVNSKVISWTNYNEWGEITHNAVLKCGQRELDLVKEYATHDYDAVLNQYYAKARFYDADNRRFTAKDPARDGFNLYAYVGNNPVNYIDPDGMLLRNISELAKEYGASVKWYSNGKEISPQDYVLINNTLLMTAADIRMFNSKWNLSAEITLNGVTKSYTAANDSDDAALSFGRMNVMIDDLEFAHDWNYVYNVAIEKVKWRQIRDTNGYITNQFEASFYDFRYGNIHMVDYNVILGKYGVACELVAIYNTLNKLGFSVTFSSVADFYEHNPGMWLKGNFGTKYWNLPDYFVNYSCLNAKKIDRNISVDYVNGYIKQKVETDKSYYLRLEELLGNDTSLIMSVINEGGITEGIHTFSIIKTSNGLFIPNSYLNTATNNYYYSSLEEFFIQNKVNILSVYEVSKK